LPFAETRSSRAGPSAITGPLPEVRGPGDLGPMFGRRALAGDPRPFASASGGLRRRGGDSF
jgi:hypothetical protein